MTHLPIPTPRGPIPNPWGVINNLVRHQPVFLLSNWPTKWDTDSPPGGHSCHPWGHVPTQGVIDQTSDTYPPPPSQGGWWMNLVRWLLPTQATYTIYGKKCLVRHGHSGSKRTNWSIFGIDNKCCCKRVKSWDGLSAIRHILLVSARWVSATVTLRQEKMVKFGCPQQWNVARFHLGGALFCYWRSYMIKQFRVMNTGYAVMPDSLPEHQPSDTVSTRNNAHARETKFLTMGVTNKCIMSNVYLIF